MVWTAFLIAVAKEEARLQIGVGLPGVDDTRSKVKNGGVFSVVWQELQDKIKPSGLMKAGKCKWRKRKRKRKRLRK